MTARPQECTTSIPQSPAMLKSSWGKGYGVWGAESIEQRAESREQRALYPKPALQSLHLC